MDNSLRPGYENGMDRLTTGASGRSILFFSGGTALKGLAVEFARAKLDSVHLITPFDSGGSSATLRRAFAMPAVGDIRSRLLALADTSEPGTAGLRALLAHRLPVEAKPRELAAELARLARGRHPLARRVPWPARGIVQEHLAWFSPRMPPDFDLAGASIGNLALAAGYLRNKRRLVPAIALFSRLLRTRGTVRPLVEDCAHLAVRLQSGAVIVGQHRFTGKAEKSVDSPICDIWLSAGENSAAPAIVRLGARNAARISAAPCICYPVGSFYSSLVANLLPQGVGRAVAGNQGLKLFVPNPGPDPELFGHSLAMQIEALLRPLLADAPGARPKDVLNLILVDEAGGRYPGGVPRQRLAELEIPVLDVSLVAGGSGRNKEPYTSASDPRLLAAAVLAASSR